VKAKKKARQSAGPNAKQKLKLPGLRPVPVVDVLFYLIFGQAIAFLNLAFELIAFAMQISASR